MLDVFLFPPAWVKNFLGILGMLALALPALRLDRAAKASSKKPKRIHEEDDWILKVYAMICNHTIAWDPWGSLMLWAGYLLILASQFLGLCETLASATN